VPDVDEALTAYAAAGYEVAERWGPPFAILSAPDSPDVWLAGPGTSAARTTGALPEADREAASVRLVIEVDDVEPTVAALVAAGWDMAGEPLLGPGGTQQLVRRGPVFLEIFAAG
jgi:hypothetical protein